jgi:S1-C subfamily serine protease
VSEFHSEHAEETPRKWMHWLLIGVLGVAGTGAGALYLQSDTGAAAVESAPVAVEESRASSTPASRSAIPPSDGGAARMVPIEPSPVRAPSVAPTPTPAVIPTPPSIEDLVSRISPAVVLIETSTARGTGFFVTQDLLITNAHVVGSNGFVTVRLAGGQTTQARVERTAAEVDLATVRANVRPETNQLLQLGSAGVVRPGMEVLAVGSPLGLQNTVTRGIVSAVRRAGGVELIQTDAAINPGNSGGPLLDREGRVIGVTTLKMSRGAESLGFAVAIAHAIPLIEGRPVATSMAPTAQRAASPSASLESVLSGGVTEADASRRTGEARFQQAMQVAAQRADQVDAQWKRLSSNCLLAPHPSDAQREWFVLRDQQVSFKASDAWCASFATDLGNYVRQFASFMAQMTEEARRAGVYPGAMRDVRRKHRLDWSGWDR